MHVLFDSRISVEDAKLILTLGRGLSILPEIVGDQLVLRSGWITTPARSKSVSIPIVRGSVSSKALDKAIEAMRALMEQEYSD